MWVNCPYLITKMGFSFFQCYQLDYASVAFHGCGCGCGAPIPPEEAVKFVNETYQYLYYISTNVSIFFSHCFNLRLHNVLLGPDTLLEKWRWNCFVANYWLLVSSHFWTVDIFSVLYYFLTSFAALSVVSILVVHVISLRYGDKCLSKLNKSSAARAGYHGINAHAMQEGESDEKLFEAAEDRARPMGSC